MLVGAGHGRTLLASIENLPHKPAPGLRLVSLMGGLTRSAGDNPHEIIHRMTELTGAEATVMPVPFMANSASDRDVLLGQKQAAQAHALAGQADLMLVGIGTTSAQAELVTTGMMEPEEMAAIAAAGGVGELLGHFFDAEGRPVVTHATQRILTLPLQTLEGRRILAIAGGRSKVGAIGAILKSGLLSGLIIDEHTARAIVDMGRESDSAAQH